MKSEKSLDLEPHATTTNGENGNREYTSSPGYDTCSSTAPASSPDPSEYTYEAAIETYKNRVSRVGQSSRYRFNGGQFSKDSTPERSETNNNTFAARKPVVKSAKMEERLLSMTMKANGNGAEEKDVPKKDLPKVDISKRRELFEKQTSESNLSIHNLTPKSPIADEMKVKSIKERMSHLEAHRAEVKHEPEELPFEIPSIRERFVILEKRVTTEDKPKVDVPLSVSLKDRLSSLQASVSASTAPNNKPMIVLDKEPEVQFERKVEETSSPGVLPPLNPTRQLLKPEETEAVDTDREDSGIHTTDVSCSVSQADEQIDEQRFDELGTVGRGEDDGAEDSLVLLAKISAREVLRTVEAQIEKELSQLAIDEIRRVEYHSQPIPDLIPTQSTTRITQHIHSTVEVEDEQPRSITPETTVEPVSLEPESHDVSVSHTSSISGSSALKNNQSHSSSTLLLDVKQLIDNLASNEKVEGASLISNDFEDTTTFNTSSMFDETTATEDSSFSLGASLGASPYHLQYAELQEDDPNVTTLPTPTLNMTVTETVTDVQQVEKEELETGDAATYEASSRLPSTEIVLDYFSKSTTASSKNSRCSSPRSPTRSLLNFIKSNLLHATSACTSEQLTLPLPTSHHHHNQSHENSKFYVPLEEIDHIDEKSRKMRDSVINHVKECKLEKKGSTDSSVTMTSEINHLLDEELAKL